MNRRPHPLTLLLLLGALVSVALAAQEHQGHHSDYGHQKSSGIAGLSAEEVRQLENGEGMGLARPAELNHYPGPRHVLDAAEELGLTEEQVRETRRTFDAMKAEAMRLGKVIVEKERELSRRFEHRHIEEKTLEMLTAEIATLYGRLRATHLRAHLEMARILTPEQIATYDRIRGYE
jgi:Spy/CpxP family protein refolding chaperone